jgi:hypothetical protein
VYDRYRDRLPVAIWAHPAARGHVGCVLTDAVAEVAFDHDPVPTNPVRPAESVLFLYADKCGPGAYNLPLLVTRGGSGAGGGRAPPHPPPPSPGGREGGEGWLSLSRWSSPCSGWASSSGRPGPAGPAAGGGAGGGAGHAHGQATGPQGELGLPPEASQPRLRAVRREPGPQPGGLVVVLQRPGRPRPDHSPGQPEVAAGDPD